MVSLPMILVQSGGGGGSFPDLPSLGDLGNSLGKAITSASEDFSRTVVESFVQPAAELLTDLIRFFFTWIILPPQPYTSAQYLDGVSVHGNGPKGSLNMANHGCQPAGSPANPGNYRSIWESMYCLNDTFTEIALTVFGGAFIIYLIALGIGWVNIENMAESLWTVTLTFIFVVANEEILGLGWAAVYAISDAIIQADLTNESYTLVGGLIAMLFGGLGAGVGGSAGVATGFSFLGSIGTLSTGFVIGAGIFLGLMMFVVMVFLLIMFFVQMIAMIGYGIFPILALLIGLGEIFDSFQGKAQKFTGLFIPAMWSPILFAIVFKISTAFVVVGGFGQGSGIDDFAISTMMGIGTLFIGTWMALKQFEAGQMAVGAATTAITTAATAGVVAATSASAGSALKGAAYGGPKGALAGAAGDAVGGNASAPMEDPQESQDQYDDIGEDVEENEEDPEDERDLEEFGDEGEPNPDEKGKLGKLKEKASKSKEAYEDTKDGYKDMKEGLSDRFLGGDEDERADLEKKEHNESALGEDGTGHATGKEIGKDGFNNDKREVAEEIEDGNIDGADAIEGVAAHRADMVGRKGEDKGEFIENAKQAYSKSVRENKNPANTWEEAQAEAFDEHMDSMTESMQASVGNAGVLYGNDFDQKWGVSRSNVMRDMDNREARQAMAADPTAGVGQDEIENHDAETVHLTDKEFGGEAASDRGVHTRSMDKAVEEEGAEEAIEEIGEAKSFEDGSVGVGMSEKAEGSIESVVDDEILERSVQDDETGLYKMSPEDARKASGQIASQAEYSGQGLTADREASILMDESARRDKRNEAMIKARRDANDYDFDVIPGVEPFLEKHIATNTYPEGEVLDDNPDAGVTDTGKAGSLHNNQVRITGETQKGGPKATQLGFRATTDIPSEEFGNGDVVARWDEENGARFEFDSPAVSDQVKQLAEENLSEGAADKVLKEMKGPGAATLDNIDKNLQYEVTEMMADNGMTIDADRGASISFTQGAPDKSLGSANSNSTIRGWEMELEDSVGNAPVNQEVNGTTENIDPDPRNGDDYGGSESNRQQTIDDDTARLRIDTPEIDDSLGEYEDKTIARATAESDKIRTQLDGTKADPIEVSDILERNYETLSTVDDINAEQMATEMVEIGDIEATEKEKAIQNIKVAQTIATEVRANKGSTQGKKQSAGETKEMDLSDVKDANLAETIYQAADEGHIQKESVQQTVSENIEVVREAIEHGNINEAIDKIDVSKEHRKELRRTLEAGPTDPFEGSETETEIERQLNILARGQIKNGLTSIDSVDDITTNNNNGSTGKKGTGRDSIETTIETETEPQSSETESVTVESMVEKREYRDATGQQETEYVIDEKQATQAAGNVINELDSIEAADMDNVENKIKQEIEAEGRDIGDREWDASKRAVKDKIDVIVRQSDDMDISDLSIGGRRNEENGYDYQSGNTTTIDSIVETQNDNVVVDKKQAEQVAENVIENTDNIKNAGNKDINGRILEELRVENRREAMKNPENVKSVRAVRDRMYDIVDSDHVLPSIDHLNTDDIVVDDENGPNEVGYEYQITEENNEEGGGTGN